MKKQKNIVDRFLTGATLKPAECELSDRVWRALVMRQVLQQRKTGEVVPVKCGVFPRGKSM